jgi:hypothetical protein
VRVVQRFCFVKLADAEIAGRAALAAKLRAALAEAGADAVVRRRTIRPRAGTCRS